MKNRFPLLIVFLLCGLLATQLLKGEKQNLPDTISTPPPTTLSKNTPTNAPSALQPLAAASLTPPLPNPSLNQGWKNEGWIMAGANPERTSWTLDEVQGDLKPQWYYHSPDYISQKVQIIASQGFLFLSTAGGLTALDAQTGEVRWKFKTELPLGHSPTVWDGIVYVGGLDHHLYALNAKDGTLLWSFAASAGFETNPLVVEGNVYAGNRDGYFYAIHTQGPQTGQLSWKFKTNGPVLYSAAYRQGTLYFASNDQYAYAVRATDGTQIWKSAKLPGRGFHSWWPVIYRDYVIFSGSYNYRYVPPYPNPHTTLEGEELYPEGVKDGDPIGPMGNEPGDWMNGTRTIFNNLATQYFESYPHRRTVIILEQKNGREYTFDSDQDGKPEYAPILWTGTHSGTRYPPAIGPDDVIYQFNNLTYAPFIARGKVSGWKFGTPYVSFPKGADTAIDEPLAYAIGGNSIYWKRCCDRMAGSFEIASSQKKAQDLESWTYYDEGGKLLRSFLPNLFEEGWDWAYWKHGDPSPPIPYQGRVYLLANNAIVAFGTAGKGPTQIGSMEKGQVSGQKSADLEKEKVILGLNVNVTADKTSWPRLLQQESYYSTEDKPSARARWFPLLQVAAGGGPPTDTAMNELPSVTVLTSTLATGEYLHTWVSRRSPTVLTENQANDYQLDGDFSAFTWMTTAGVRNGQKGTKIDGEELSEGWLLLWEKVASGKEEISHRWSPIVISLQRRPIQIEMTEDGILLHYSSAAGYLGVTPLYGMQGPRSEEAEQWAAGLPPHTLTRIRQMDRLARAFPQSVQESWQINSNTGDVTFQVKYQYIEVSSDWGVPPRRLAYLPPRLALAAWGDSPIRINGKRLEQQLDLEYLVPLGRVAGVADSDQAQVVLPGLAKYWQEPRWPRPVVPPGDPLQEKLAVEVQKILQAGHLLPGYGMVGIWEGRARERLGDDLTDYWKNPADTVITLLQALPWLPPDLQNPTRAYVRAEIEKYPLATTAHVGWAEGANRHAFDLPPEVVQAGKEFSPQAKTNFNGWGLPPQNFYALWMAAREFGNAQELFSASKHQFNDQPRFQASLPYSLNATLSGTIGYLRLAQLAGEQDPQAEQTMIQLWVMRAALSKYPEALQETGFEYGGAGWTLRMLPSKGSDTLFSARVTGSLWSQLPLYGFPVDLLYNRSGAAMGGDYTFAIDFVYLTSEIAAFLNDYAAKETRSSLSSDLERTPYWFLAWAEEGAGEGVFQPLYDRWAYFQAKAYLEKSRRAELELYLDVPAVQVGDLYYLQNLIATLQAQK